MSDSDNKKGIRQLRKQIDKSDKEYALLIYRYLNKGREILLQEFPAETATADQDKVEKQIGKPEEDKSEVVPEEEFSEDEGQNKKLEEKPNELIPSEDKLQDEPEIEKTEEQLVSDKEIKRTDEESQIVEDINELRQSMLELKEKYQEDNSRISYDNYLVAVRDWEKSLYDLNSYFRKNLSQENTELEGNNLYDEYKTNIRKLDELQQKIKEIKEKPTSKVEEEENMLSKYDAYLMDSSRIYNLIRS
jgi:hypothetical protein